MKLKKKYRIDGEDWPLIQADGNAGYLGRTDHDNMKMFIDMESAHLESTLLHEFLHVISHNRSIGLEEDQVISLSFGLIALIRDNKINFLEDIET